MKKMPSNNNSNVYQFKITLKGAKPPIWRRIQVPESYNFHQLHVAIQCSMGWKSASMDYHLHKFNGIESEEEKKIKISKYFSETNKKVMYEYDFGDGWEHHVLFEKILPAESSASYPKCLTGKRACPPEDCGGIDGYEDLLEIISDPKNKGYKDMKEWLQGLGYTNGEFKSEEFDPRMAFNSSGL